MILGSVLKCGERKLTTQIGLFKHYVMPGAGCTWPKWPVYRTRYRPGKSGKASTGQGPVHWPTVWSTSAFREQMWSSKSPSEDFSFQQRRVRTQRVTRLLCGTRKEGETSQWNIRRGSGMRKGWLRAGGWLEGRFQNTASLEEVRSCKPLWFCLKSQGKKRNVAQKSHATWAWH